ncbi:MAG: UrcA family protein [Sphingomonadales bacterium]|jgi:UrcA family protein
MRAMMIMVAAMLAAPAMAAEPTQVRVTTVGLDLSTASGQRALNHRVASAIVKLCGMPSSYTAEESAAIGACQTEAMSSAAPQIDAAHGRRAMTVASIR